MKKYENLFLFSVGDDGEDYGLYIMELNCKLHDEESYLVYYYDGDKFVHIKKDDRKYFSPYSEIKLVKDEFGKEYSGKALSNRFLECIKAYKEGLPGYAVFCKELDDKILECD